jgi:hypothetical protein
MLDFLRRHWALRKLWSGCPLFIRFFYDLNFIFTKFIVGLSSGVIKTAAQIEAIYFARMVLS